MEYGSTPYIGMARKKNVRHIECVQDDSYGLSSLIPVILQCFNP